MQIYSNIEEPKFRNQLIFEIKSWIGRNFKRNESKITPTGATLLLDLGVGGNFTVGWKHVDFYRIRLKFWKKFSKSTQMPEIQTDLRYPLNCPSNIVDGVYSGHTLEHLYPKHAYQLLGEIFRILKPECWLRINVPDLKYGVDYYNGKVPISPFKYKAEYIVHLTQNFGHHSVWDEELLSKALEISGFKNIQKVEFGKEGTDKRLIKEQEGRRIGTIVLEAQKP